MTLRTPPLRDRHAEAGARFTDFGGWEMPVEFDSIREEHAAVRESVGAFDVSHMGQILVAGPDAPALTDRLVTSGVADAPVGTATYAGIVDEDGILQDDTVVYRLPDGTTGLGALDPGADAADGDPAYLFVPNAGHDEWALDRWTAHRDRWDLDATVHNRTADVAMFAVQGPDARDLVADLADGADGDRLLALERFEAAALSVAGVACWVARTGYTGEDGVELLCPAGEAETVWAALDCRPCGLGARDTLRQEAGLLLSGQDFHPEENPRTPHEAGIGFVVDLDGDREFVGREALEGQAAEGPAETRVGLRLLDRGVPREGYPVETPDGERVGTVTSGTMSPTLGYPIATTYVPVAHAEAGTELRVRIRDEPKTAKVVGLPFLEDR